MGTITCPEVRSDFSLTSKERAEARDSFVRSFERQFSDWTEIAKVCIEVERDRDFEILGFSSWHSWLLNAAPRSRSYIYLVVGRYKELSPDIPDEELATISLGSATVLRKLPTSLRRDPVVKQSAQQQPGEFINTLRHLHPDQLLEPIIKKQLTFTASQWAIIEPVFEAFKTTDETASLADFMEWLVSECK